MKKQVTICDGCGKPSHADLNTDKFVEITEDIQTFRGYEFCGTCRHVANMAIHDYCAEKVAIDDVFSTNLQNIYQILDAGSPDSLKLMLGTQGVEMFAEYKRKIVEQIEAGK